MHYHVPIYIRLLKHFQILAGKTVFYSERSRVTWLLWMDVISEMHSTVAEDTSFRYIKPLIILEVFFPMSFVTIYAGYLINKVGAYGLSSKPLLTQPFFTSCVFSLPCVPFWWMMKKLRKPPVIHVGVHLFTSSEHEVFIKSGLRYISSYCFITAVEILRAIDS